MSKCWLVLCLLATSTAFAASFDCAKAKSPQEKAICASPDLSRADEQMAAAYTRALAATPSVMVEQVRADQRAWLNQLSVVCTPTKRHAGQNLVSCLLDDYEYRINQLQNLVLREPGVTFVWRSLFLNADDSDRGILRVWWPQAASDKTEWKRWNNAIEAAAQSLFTWKSGPQEWQSSWATFGDTVLTATIDTVNEQWIASTIEVGQDRDWHPLNGRIQFYWMLREGRELQAEDVFQRGTAWERELRKACAKSVHSLFSDGEGAPWGATLAYYWGEAQTESEVLSRITHNPRKYWQINQYGLTIDFLPYQEMCIGCGLDPITIPWHHLKPYLRASFVVPQEIR